MIEGAGSYVSFGGPMPEDKFLVVSVENLRDAAADLHDVLVNGQGGEIRAAGCEKGTYGSAVFPMDAFADQNELTVLYKARETGRRGRLVVTFDHQ